MWKRLSFPNRWAVIISITTWFEARISTVFKGLRGGIGAGQRLLLKVPSPPPHPELRAAGQTSHRLSGGSFPTAHRGVHCPSHWQKCSPIDPPMETTFSFLESAHLEKWGAKSSTGGKVTAHCLVLSLNLLALNRPHSILTSHLHFLTIIPSPFLTQRPHCAMTCSSAWLPQTHPSALHLLLGGAWLPSSLMRGA